MLLLAIPLALAGDCSLETGAYLLTMEPGDGVQTIFGHTAVLLYDAEQGAYSPVYDYGRFELDPPLTMAWEVLTMTKDYSMGARALGDTVGFYDFLGRGITAQRLTLDSEEQARLGEVLAADLNAELHFDYNWYRPNCTTMVQERLDGVLGGHLQRELTALPGPSPAGEVLRHSGPHLPLWFGLNWGSGGMARTPVDAWSGAYLPAGLRMAVAKARNARGEPLVEATCVLGEVQPAEVPPRGPSRTGLLWALGMVWAGGVLGVSRLGRAPVAAAIALHGLLVGLFGAAAVLVSGLGTFAPFWGDLNLTLASPLHLLLIPAAALHARRGDHGAPMVLAAVLVLLAVVGAVGGMVIGAGNLGLAGLFGLPAAGILVALRPSSGAGPR